MSAARGMYAAPAARRALTDGSTGVVELALSRCAYVRLEREWVLLATAGAPFGPLSLTIDRPLELRPGMSARVACGRLVIGGHEISLQRLRARPLLAVIGTPRGQAPAVAAAAVAALAALPAAPPSLRRGLRALKRDRIGEAVAALAGLGEGLTPAGDDLLAGYVAARVALAPGLSSRRPRGEPLACISTLAAGRASPVGLAYLRCAERGELPEPAARVLAAICGGSAARAKAAISPLRRWGASSGAALAWGMGAAVTSLCRVQPAV